MSKNIVECVHWDPEVDAPAQTARQKNRWVLLAVGLAVVAVAVGAGLALLLPKREAPIEPTTEPGQATVAMATTESAPAQTQPQPAENPDLTRGIEYYNAGNYVLALATLNQAVAAQPDSGAAYTYRGLTQYSTGSYQAAAQDFTQAMIRMGESAELVTLRGTSYYMQALYPEAIADLTKGLELNPGNTNALTYRAMAYEATGKMDLAQADRARIGQ